MRRITLATETSSVRTEVISAMVEDVLIEVDNSGNIEQIGKEERKK